MRRFIAFISIVLVFCIMTGCVSYVDIDKNKDKEITDIKEQEATDTQAHNEEPINPIVVQKLSMDEAKKKAEKIYGGKETKAKLNGEYDIDGMLYYVFDFGADIGGMFSRDFSVVVDAQSGEIFEGNYDKVNKKIIRY